MKTDSPKTIYLKDYQPYPYEITHIDLLFDIRDGETLVTSTLAIKSDGISNQALYLNGENLELISLKLDDRTLSEEAYITDKKSLTLPPPGLDNFTLEIVTCIKPEENTRLEGLYCSGGTYCTQCEAEGFRSITYYPDRPDVMTIFTVRIEANKTSCPVLLSNGNRLDHGDLEELGRHFSVWHDPFPKPCYLFALVAGDLTHIEDEFTTKSGRKVELFIYVRHGDEGQCAHALESLKASMKWEEDVYGLEYDLDIFNIVAVSDFNMGAMENKSLNIFNTALTLTHQDTATDQDFMRVEGVVAHEYFHNWSGNRVTCRDWFQLSLKEGLTVFRDQEFSADMNSRAVQRIDDVSHLRRFQFPEDAGPLAHPIRPDNYIEINNFYTMTVYEKGAEIIRMLHTILGPENYRKGTDLYFSRHDGEAATCDNFVTCMEEASGIDLRQFKLWYSQAGTPEVTFKSFYEESTKTYCVELSQNIPDTPGQSDKKPMHIPIALGLVDKNGKDLQELTILHLTKKNQNFTFHDIASKPTPSILRGFSAPVKLSSDLTAGDLEFLMIHDSDGFNRWEAGQTYALRVINAMLDEESPPPEFFVMAYGELLSQSFYSGADKALIARTLNLPDISTIGQSRENIDPPAIYEAREVLKRAILETHGDEILQIYKENRTDTAFSITPEAMGKRALQNSMLSLLSAHKTQDDAKRAKAHYQSANNMTDRVAALHVLSNIESSIRDEAFNLFYNKFKEFPLVIDKYFSLQACAVRKDIIPTLKSLRVHEDFNIKNPNRVRSLYNAFAMNNPASFHAADGSGYEFLRDAVIELNTINPQIAARLLTPLRDWRRYTPGRQKKISAALEAILVQDNLSPDVFEIASKSLKG